MVAAVDAAGLLEDLDADQRRAVECPSTLVAVVAGAGSGKTRVLTRRVAHRVASGAADARHTLVLTFTREAAGELRRRLPRLGLSERVEAGTFHSVMLGVLRQRWADLGRQPPTVVGDRRRLLAELTSRSTLDEVVAEVDWSGARGIGAAEYASAARRHGRRTVVGAGEVSRVLDEYATLKRRRGVVDLDDLLTIALDWMTNDRAFADATRWRFRHLLVDEAQDLNPVQHRLLDELRRGHDDVFLVGDPAQAVYGFNGADPALLVDVADRFPGVEIVRLHTNHRCTPQIVDIGVHVLGAGHQRAALVSGRADGPEVRVVACADETDEAAMLPAALRRLEPSLLRRSDVAVLARTHMQLAAIRTAIEGAGIPVRRRVDGPGSPYADPIATAIRLGSAARLRAWAHDVLDDAADAAPDDTSDSHRQEVARAVLEFLREQPLGDGTALRAWLATTDALGGGRAEGVDLLTFHAAKGREWHTVFVTGVETGLVPHRTATTQPARAEEARLLYVALTRATDELVVSWAARRGGYQRRRSPLLDGYTPPVAVPVAPPAELVSFDGARRLDRSLHDDLVSWRDRTARATGLLPEAVCTTSMLRSIARSRPSSPDDLAEVTGVGMLTAQRWYPALRAVLDADQSRRSTTTGA
jgi:DNA helicase-2/ATP-dependent DNA helicase PcrA